MSLDMSQVTPEYLAETRVPAMMATIWVTRVIAWIFVGLRFYAKRRGGSKYAWDDWVLFITLIVLFGAIPLEALAVTYGLGRHVQYVFMFKTATLSNYGQVLYAEQVLYPVLIGPIKVSILLFYIRMFGSNNKLRWACYIQIVAVIIWVAVVFFLFAFQCTPVHVGWNITRQGGTCLEYSPLFIGTNTINVVMDFIILITPIPVIWGLQLPKAKKIWVIIILAFGACESIFSSARLGVLAHANFEDPTWQHVDAFIWSLVECHIGLVCACLPILGPLLPSYKKKQAYGSGGYGSSNNKGSGSRPAPGYSKMESQFGGVELGHRSNRDSEQDTSGILHTVEWSVSSENGRWDGGHSPEGQAAPRQTV